MPGILPMKVIKVGSSAQSRIAQACDRCRSKKIRCDGIRPCCSQCSNVGFECKTSDKLSRRAFPRGYTESLEERVRSLEGEVRELKDLLDEKDEKIDILSKMHPNTKPSSIPSPNKKSAKEIKEEVIRVQASPLLFECENSDSYFMGASSGRAFVDAFKRKIQESGKSCTGFNTDGFLNLHDLPLKKVNDAIANSSLPPPRLFTDRMVNIFFQEWAPLFPILHKPSFLRSYEQFVEQPEQMTDKQKLAQLYLVLGIAALSSEAPDTEQIDLCEAHWRIALDGLVKDNTLITLQCLILAQLFCIAKGDYKCLQHYKAIAVGLSHRLGLHQSQKRFSFGALTMETRKRVFWSLYTVDCFSAASLGLPKLLTEADVYAEYPNDIDDEYVTEKGFQPTLPGEYTKISSALALFKVSRILSKVLEKNYPAAASHDLSLSSIQALEEEIKEWSANLPNHLKLTFVQDKPSSNVIGSRSPLLSLTFYYIRTLIHRPVIGSCTSVNASSSVIALADSSKHIIQITQLLQERHLAFSLCLNKHEVLTLCGLTLLYQRLDLKQDGRLMKDGQELIQEVIKFLSKSSAQNASDFTKLALYMGIEDPLNSRTETRCGKSDSSNQRSGAAKRQANTLTLGTSASDVTQRQQRTSTSQVDNVSPSELFRHPLESALVAHQYRHSATPTTPKPGAKNKRPNLDYLSLSSPESRSQSTSPVISRKSFSSNLNRDQSFRQPLNAHTQQNCIPTPPSSWENILGSVDEAQIFDAMYGGTPLPLSLSSEFCSSTAGGGAHKEKYARSNGSEWSPSVDGWDVAGLNPLRDFGRGGSAVRDNASSSVLSLSEESLSSGEEYGDAGARGGDGSAMEYEHIMLAGQGHEGEGFHLDDDDLGRW